MWTVLTWPVRTRPVRRVLMVVLGLVIRRRLRATRTALGSEEEEHDGGRRRWLIGAALAVGGVVAGVVYRNRSADTEVDLTWSSTPAEAGTVPPAPTEAEATPPTPQLGVADLARAPAEPDLAAGEAAIGRSLATDDLKVVEGIGPKIEQLLNDNGVRTWHDLAVTDVDRLHTILTDAGSRYRMHDPSSWPRQAALLVEGDWDGFARLNSGDVTT